jgi:hypothetical protein
MKHFLLVYDKKAGVILETKVFSDNARRIAMAERFKREALYRNDPNIEVVVLGANSAAALRKTHSRYFSGELASRSAAAFG